MNITDVEDKIIRNAAAAHQTIYEYTAPIHRRRSSKTPRPCAWSGPSTSSRPPITSTIWSSAIQKLEERGYTYISDGSVYYRIAKFPGYGKLSHNDFSGIRSGARVDMDEYDKADARDFVLWKAQEGRRAGVADSAGRGPARLAHRVLRDGDEVSGRDARHPHRRRGPDVSASRKRNRAIGSASPASRSRASGCTPNT